MESEGKLPSVVVGSLGQKGGVEGPGPVSRGDGPGGEEMGQEAEGCYSEGLKCEGRVGEGKRREIKAGLNGREREREREMEDWKEAKCRQNDANTSSSDRSSTNINGLLRAGGGPHVL